MSMPKIGRELQIALVTAILALSIGLNAGAPMGADAARGAAMIPVHFKARDPSGSVTLSPDYYAWASVQLETGMNATFQVHSNTTVNVYFMSSSQFANFQSTGSTQSIYSSEGTSVSADVGPLSAGTYYLVVYNDISSQNAYVNYNLSTIPVNIYSFHQSLPAPVGITDYGVLNASGVLYPYKILYNEAIGFADIYSLQAYNSSPPAGVSPYGASLQQNVVLQVNTTEGNYEYWLQNVPNFWTNNDTMYFVDNVWNLSASTSYLTNQTITGNGYVSYCGNDAFYGYATSTQRYALPLTLYLVTNYNYSQNAVTVSFGYAFSANSPITWYDNVTIHDSNITAASLVVDGYETTPRGIFYDSELVFGGEGNGEQTYFTRMNATLLMWYVLPNGSKVLPPAIYGFGSDTAEAADDLSTALVGGYPTVEVGGGNFEPVETSVALPAYSANVSLQIPPVDAGMDVHVEMSSAVSNGVAPYTYYFYVDGEPAYNFTTYSSQYSGAIDLPPLGPGTYSLQVAVYDALGRVSYSSKYTIIVNRDPEASLASNASVTDVGLPLNVSYYAYYGTAPYNFSFYVNGNLVARGYDAYSNYLGSYAFVPDHPGTWTAEIVVTDSAGYTTSYVFNVTVNPDPIVRLSTNVSVTDVGLPVGLSSSASLGTPPYAYAWYVDGREVSDSQNYTFVPSSPGTYSIRVAVKDSVGYTTYSEAITVSVNPDPELNLACTRNVTDVGLPISLSAEVGSGTPPYAYAWYVDGQMVGSSASTYSFDPGSPGIYDVEVVVSDSAGYTVNGFAAVSVNPDPSISNVTSTLSSDNIFYANTVAQLSVDVKGGTPPYNYSWYLNGRLLATTSSPTYSYSLGLGRNTVQVEVTDSLGYSVMSRPVTVVTSYNYAAVGGLAAAVAAAALVTALARGRVGRGAHRGGHRSRAGRGEGVPPGDPGRPLGPPRAGGPSGPRRGNRPFGRGPESTLIRSRPEENVGRGRISDGGLRDPEGYGGLHEGRRQGRRQDRLRGHGHAGRVHRRRPRDKGEEEDSRQVPAALPLGRGQGVHKDRRADKEQRGDSDRGHRRGEEGEGRPRGEGDARPPRERPAHR